MRKSVFCTLAAILAFTACNILSVNPDDSDNTEGKKLELSTKSAEMVQKGHDFSLNFLQKIDHTGSYIVSPLSMQFLLGMMLDGADGRTADEICEVLGFGAGEVEAVNEYSKELLTQLPKLDSKTTLTIANSVLVDKTGHLLDSYKKTVSTYYDAYVESIDFRNSGMAVSKINNWCSRNTNGLIPKIVDNLPEDTYACLLNALYFKGKWSSPFNKSATASEQFTDESGAVSKIRMMKKERDSAYGWNDVYQAVQLPYGNGAFKMTIVLPLEGHTVSDAIASIKESGWKAFLSGMTIATVNIWLPRFETTFEAKLNDELAALGMPSAFSPLADFSLMTRDPVCIDFIKQKAVIKVDEDGSEAAAVSIGVMMPTSAGPDEYNRVDFHADHPFVYFISENRTGAILFAGRFEGK